MAKERVLTTRELNRALLARQLLLERHRLPLPRAVERMGGVQAQYAPSMYIGLWSRLEGFGRDDLTRALERGSVVQGTLMRETIHLVSRRDYWALALGTRAARRAWWLRTHGRDVGERRMRAAAARLRRALADGPRPRTELQGTLRGPGWVGVGNWLDLLRMPPSGTWERRRADLYAVAEDVLGPPTVTPEEGVELLVRRYLGAFGPARPADVAAWAGLPAAAVSDVVERLRVRRFRDEDGRELVDLPRGPLPPADAPAPVRFLPTWDATLLTHARRTQILPEQYRPLVFDTKTPHSSPTFLVDGAVAGTWRYEKGRVELRPFDPLPWAARRELSDESKRLAAFHA
jgi:hypothetical protein